MIGVGCEALPVTPENNESQLLKNTNKQHRVRVKADEDTRRLKEIART